MCFLTQSVRLPLSSVQLTLLECVICEVAKCLEIVEKMNRFALLNFKIFWEQCPQTPILGTGYGAPPQTLPPQHSGASRLRASLGAFGPSIVPLCV